MSTQIYNQEQVVYLMQTAITNVATHGFRRSDSEVLELIELVETHDEYYEKIDAGVELEVSRLLLQIATERERTAQAIRERDDAITERNEVEERDGDDE